MGEHQWQLPQTVEAPALTRRLLADACTHDCVPEARLADCSLMATELVTNAVVHGRGEITLTLDCAESGGVRVEVRDGGPADPGARPRPVGPDSETGRGFLIVEAL